MTARTCAALVACLWLAPGVASGQSFEDGVAPLVERSCLACHGDHTVTPLNLARLGFDLTERVLSPEGEMNVSFVSCSNKAHDLAFVEYPEPNKLHHVSFMLMTWEEVLRAADLMSMHDISIDIGPTRHGITRGRTIYFFDPSGNRNEVFCGDYTWYPDREPITWTAEELGRAIFYHDRRLNENFLSVVT